MKFIYVGSGEASPKETTVFGVKFTRGGPAVDVKDKKAVAKLSANPSFSKPSDVKAKDEGAPTFE